MSYDDICHEREATCHCVLPVGHDGPHECVPDPVCGGSWWRHPDEPGRLRIYRYPSNRPGCDGWESASELEIDDPAEGEWHTEVLWHTAPRGEIKFIAPPALGIEP